MSNVEMMKKIIVMEFDILKYHDLRLTKEEMNGTKGRLKTSRSNKREIQESYNV